MVAVVVSKILFCGLEEKTTDILNLLDDCAVFYRYLLCLKSYPRASENEVARLSLLEAACIRYNQPLRV